MQNASFNQPRRQRPASFDSQFTAGPAPRGRRHHDAPHEHFEKPRRGRGRGRGFGPEGFGPGGPGFGPGAPGVGPGGPGFGPGGPGRSFGPGGPGAFGPGGPRRGRGGPRGRGRAARGDVRAAILLLLKEQPMHGYQIIQEITERSQGAWTPSPGAVYPAIGLLTDEGLVTTTAEGGRNLASLTEEGRAYVEANAQTLGTPWADAAANAPHRRHELRSAVEAIIDATRQVGRVGDDKQVTAALEVLAGARRELYLILAGEGATPAADGEAPAS